MVMLKSKLRPGWVDWGVYQRVQVQLEPIERVAKDLWLTPEKVMLWVEQIMAYVLMATKKDLEEEAAEGKNTEPVEVRMAKELASARIGHLVDLALQAFEDSKGWQPVVRRKGNDAKSVSTYNLGNQKYLMTAARLMEMQAKLAPPRLGRLFVPDLPTSAAEEENYPTFAAAALQMTAAEEEAVRQRYLAHLAVETARKQAAAADKAAADAAHEAKNQTLVAEEGESEEENHPNGAFSDSAVNRGSEAEDDDPNRPLNPDELAICVAKYWAGEMAKRESQRPVQLAGPGGVQATLPKEKKTRRKAFLRGSPLAAGADPSQGDSTT